MTKNQRAVFYDLLTSLEVDKTAGYNEDEHSVVVIGNVVLEVLNAARNVVGLPPEDKPQ
jgi:hypothetical protein